ncbi:MAG TPA: alpha/beta fold hydrolase [Pyrinomonadaceae bacterium]|nr:alpha/beta fold hydrolase [Pyrinomonadaceae bacterium]
MSTSTLASTWFRPRLPNPKAKLRLFCFPYAGGTSSIFNNWPRELSAEVEVCPVHLPGRESRFRERSFTRVGPLVETMAQAISTLMDKPFAFFGHSMGAILGFELIHLLQREGRPLPFCFFASGRSAPQKRLKTAQTFHLPESEFIEQLRRLNGTPKEVLEHEELMGLMIPILRADFEICETYSYTPGPKLGCAITALGGAHDRDVPSSHLAGWRDHTDSIFSQYIFPGDHFFLHSAEKQLLHTLGQELARLSPRSN